MGKGLCDGLGRFSLGSGDRVGAEPVSGYQTLISLVTTAWDSPLGHRRPLRTVLPIGEYHSCVGLEAPAIPNRGYARCPGVSNGHEYRIGGRSAGRQELLLPE